MVAKYNALVLPGRYGGDYNNDQLAIVEGDGKVTLMLGLKLLEDNGGLQLDNASLGPHTQYSNSWIRALVGCLSCNPETENVSVKINQALEAGALDAVVLILNQDSHQVSLLKINILP